MFLMDNIVGLAESARLSRGGGVSRGCSFRRFPKSGTFSTKWDNIAHGVFYLLLNLTRLCGLKGISCWEHGTRDLHPLNGLMQKMIGAILIKSV